MKKFLTFALALCATLVSAQTLKGIKAETAQVQLGQPVNVTVDLEYSGAPNCGLRVRWGDGAVTEGKLNAADKIPFKVSHTYTKAGDYTIVADPGKVGGSFKCVGSNASAMVKVVAPPPAPVAVAPAAAGAATAAAAPAGPTCPDGWKLNPKSVNKKSGAYTCGAKAGTPLPEKRLSCPGDLSYFENAKRGTLGCRS
jgi:hypothetical protein